LLNKLKLNWLSPSLFSIFTDRHHYYGLVRPCTAQCYLPRRFTACALHNYARYKFPCSDKMPESGSCCLYTACRLARSRLLLLNSIPGEVVTPQFWQGITRYRCFSSAVHMFNSLILTWRISFAF